MRSLLRPLATFGIAFLYFPPAFEIRETPRAAAVVVLAAVALAACVIGRYPRWGWRVWTSAAWVGGALVVTCLAASSPERSLFGPFPYGPGALLYAAYGALLLLPSATPPLVWLAVHACFGAVEGALALVQVFAFGAPPTGTLGHPAFVGAACGGAVLSAVGAVATVQAGGPHLAELGPSMLQRTWMRRLLVVFAVLCALGLAMSGRRGPVLALLVAGGVVLVAIRPARRAWRRIGLALGGFVASLALLQLSRDAPLGRWWGGGDGLRSLVVRWQTYRRAVQVIGQRPWLGWGFCDFRDFFAAGGGTSSLTEGRVHNILLHLWVAGGAVLVLPIVVLVAVLLVRGYEACTHPVQTEARAEIRARQVSFWPRLFALAQGLYYAVHLMGNVDQPAVGVWVATLIGVGLAPPLARESTWRLRRLVGACVLVAGAMVALTPLVARTALAQGLRFEAEGRQPAAQGAYELAMELGATDCRAQMQWARLQRAVHPHSSAASRLEVLQACGERLPRAAPVFVELAWAYEDSEGPRSDQALAAMRHAYALAPALSSTARGLARILAGRGNLGEARRVLQRAVGRDPNNPQVLNDLGVVLDRSGLREQARRAFAAAVRLAPQNRRFRANWQLVGGPPNAGPSP